MIRLLTGKIIQSRPPIFIIDVNGVGYEVISSTVKIKAGEKGTISVYTVVKEDSFTLYGFNNEEERGLFALMLGVNGVGPKSALAIVGDLSSEEITTALQAGDAAPFRKVKGIGKKAAERIVIDLSGSINRAMADDPNALALSAALQNLGYTQREYAKLIPEAPAGSIEEQLTWALNQLTN